MSIPCISWCLSSPNERSQSLLGEMADVGKGSMSLNCPVLGRKETTQMMGMGQNESGVILTPTVKSGTI